MFLDILEIIYQVNQTQISRIVLISNSIFHSNKKNLEFKRN